jgi:hypothetical protein
VQYAKPQKTCASPRYFPSTVPSLQWTGKLYGPYARRMAALAGSRPRLLPLPSRSCAQCAAAARLPGEGARPRRGFTIARASIVRTRAVVQRSSLTFPARRVTAPKNHSASAPRQITSTSSGGVQSRRGLRFLLTCTRQPLTLQQSTVARLYRRARPKWDCGIARRRRARARADTSDTGSWAGTVPVSAASLCFFPSATPVRYAYYCYGEQVFWFVGFPKGGLHFRNKIGCGSPPRRLPQPDSRRVHRMHKGLRFNLCKVAARSWRLVEDSGKAAARFWPKLLAL